MRMRREEKEENNFIKVSGWGYLACDNAVSGAHVYACVVSVKAALRITRLLIRPSFLYSLLRVNNGLRNDHPFQKDAN